MTTMWLEIRYRDFYDVPRAVVVRWQGRLYLLDSQFDPDADEYDVDYSVYLMPTDLEPRIDEISWTDLGHHGEYVGTVATANIEFDPSKRKSINAEIIQMLGLE